MTGRPEPRRVLVGAALVAGALWLPVLLFWGDAPFAVTFDDAWYYFEIGRNIAAGHGSTFDTINQTNGYHPLWMGASVATYALGLDDLAAVRALLTVQLGCWIGALVLVARVADASSGGFPRLRGRDDGDAAITRAVVTAAAVLALLGANPYVIRTTVNGLESGAVVLTQALALALVWRRHGRVLEGTTTDRLLLGAVLALAFLARTDAVVLVGCIGLWALLEARSAGSGAVGRLATVFAPPAVVMAGWFAFSTATFGEPLQVSGETKRLALTADRAAGLALVAAVAAALVWWGRQRMARAPGPSRFPRTSTFVARTAWFAAFCVLIVGYYSQLSAQQWLWYYAPHVLYLTFLAVLVALDFCEGVVVEAPVDRPAGRAMAPVQAILLGLFGIAFGVQLVAFTDPDRRSIQLANRQAGEWISANLPADARLASWDAGVVGYFTEQPVVNLDGVVNSFDWLDAKREGTTAAFLRDEGVGYTVNHAAMVDGEDATIVADVTALLGPQAGDGLEQVHRVEFTYSGRVEGQSGDTTGTWAVFVYRLPPP